jgi:crotonobetainyl-CoA:carnitine CoA-transferase CaiB-like acyl-CoA transferase
MLERCPVLDWASSGAMALTGHRDQLPAVSPAPAFGALRLVTGQLAEATRETGSTVRADPGVLLTGRAALAGFTRRGRVSAGGSARLLRTADGWCAVTLSREDDVAAVRAILGSLGLDDRSLATGHGDGDLGRPSARMWTALEAAARARPAAALAAAAQLLGVPAAALPRDPPTPDIAPWPPWRTTGIATPCAAARLAGAVVADLSSMWAGPLCARMLGLAGAHVVKVETPDRPDGARAGARAFYDWLHAGHRSMLADFRTESGRAALAALLAAADVVVEASRPRALANLGLAPEMIPHRDGQVWLSITGYGREEPDRVAFGDDAAVAGGLVGWTGGIGWADGEPVFCADAIADPLTGVCGALAIARSIAEGGGQLIDLSMRAVAASFAAARGPGHGPHGVRPDGTVSCPALGREQAVLPPRRPGPAGPAAEPGADTDAVLAWLAAC